MATTRSFTGYLFSQLGVNPDGLNGTSFNIATANAIEFNITDNDGDATIGGDTTNEQSSDADQFLSAGLNGSILFDGVPFYLESTFTFTIGGQTFTGFHFEVQGTGEDFLIMPPGVPAGTITVTSQNFNPSPNEVNYAALSSGDENIDQNNFASQNFGGGDTIIAGAGNDRVDAGAGNDSVDGGAGADNIAGNAGNDTITGGSGADTIVGDGGDQPAILTRESFNWSQLADPDGDGTLVDNGDDISGGVSQNTGTVNVALSIAELGRFQSFEYRVTNQNVTGIDSGGETINATSSGFLEGDGVSPAGDTASLTFDFSSNTANVEDEVRNVSFRINDVDDANWRDIVEVQAFNADGEQVPVTLTVGANHTLTEGDGFLGAETVTANNGSGNQQPTTLAASILVEVDGPVSQIVVTYGNLETGGQRIDFTDIFFDSVRINPNTATGDDSILGGSGADVLDGQGGNDSVFGGADSDVVSGGAGSDLLQGGTGADFIFGGADADTIRLQDNFGADVISGGEAGTDSDTIDHSALSAPVNVVYNANEAGTTTDGVSTATFSQIENQILTTGADTLDAAATNNGVNVDGREGSDSLGGGAGADTLIGGLGDDTLAGRAGGDFISGAQGLDVVDYSDSDAAVQIDLSAGTQTGGHATGDIYGGGIDGIIGSAFGDSLTGFDGESTVPGDAFTNLIFGGGGADTIDGRAGADSLFGGTGDDLMIGGAGADSQVGGDDRDTFILNAGFGSDTIAGGEGGTDSDTIDHSGLGVGVNVTYSANEAGATTDGTDTAGFSEIENQILTAQADTLDASATDSGVNVSAGAGTDSITGGAGADTVLGGADDDTIAAGAGADSVDAGDGADRIRIEDGFGADTIIGGEGGTDSDTIDQSALGAAVNVTYNANEAGTTTDGTDTAGFTEIENQILTGFDDTLDASATTSGVNVDAGAGRDTLRGGAGNDTLIGAAGLDTFDGGSGDDSLSGGEDADLFIMRDGFGSDTIDGGEGGIGGGGLAGTDFNPPLDAEPSGDFDTVDFSALTTGVTVNYNASETGIANAGANSAAFSNIERFILSANGDTLDGQAETESLNVDGGDGGDSLTGGTGGDFLIGGEGGDTLTGGLGADFLFGGEGDDSIFGGEGDDRVYAGAGDDFVISTPGVDYVFGGDGADTIEVGQSADSVFGGAGADSIDAGSEDDLVFGGAGSDTILGGDPDAGSGEGGGNDTLFGNDGADSIDGGEGDDSIAGGAGDDTIIGGDGADSIEGDGGIDLNRESFNWDLIPDPNGGDPIDNNDDLTGGTVQDTGNVSVTMSYVDDGAGPAFVFRNTRQNIDGLDGGPEAVDDRSSAQFQGSGIGPNATVTLDFAGNAPNTLDEVRNVQFRLNDIDDGGFRDAFTIRAFDGAGNPIEVILTGGSEIILTDTDGVAGADTATVANGTGGASPTDLSNSVLVEIPGPVGSIEISYSNLETVFQAAWVTDVFFDAQTLNQDGGDDSILGGEGADTILGQAGSDTIDGGLDADSIDGGDDQDTIVLTDNFGADTIAGGEGGTDGDTLDQSALSAPVNVVYTGDEAGTTTDGTSTATFSEIETQILTSGDDTLDATLDTVGVNVLAGDGGDSLLGGSGADTIDAGTGDDTLDGGAGSDSLTGGNGFDDFIVSAGDDTITDFNTADGQVLNDGDQTNNDFIDLAPYYDNLAELRADFADDGILNQSNTIDTKGRPVDYADNTALPGTITLNAVNGNELFFDNTNVVCFARGTLIRTGRGEVAVEDLAEGDLVETRDNGLQPIRWIGRRSLGATALDAQPRLRPIVISAGALGNARTLRVSPQHRMLVRSWRAELMFGEAEVLVKAADLVDGDRIYAAGAEEVEYFHILFDGHEIIFAEGAEAESFHPGEQALSTLEDAAREELLTLFPELAETSRPLARHSLKAYEAKALLH